MEVHAHISMYPDHAYIIITIVNEFGDSYSTYDLIDKEKALRLAKKFNLKID